MRNETIYTTTQITLRILATAADLQELTWQLGRLKYALRVGEYNAEGVAIVDLIIDVEYPDDDTEGNDYEVADFLDVLADSIRGAMIGGMLADNGHEVTE